MDKSHYCQGRIIVKVNKWLKYIQHIRAPHCVFCNSKTQQTLDLCDACYQDLPWIKWACYRCGLPLAINSKIYCGACQQHPPPFDRTISLFHYNYPADQLIIGLKFQEKLNYGRMLGSLLGARILREYQTSSLPDVIIPVPLHNQRLKERGYNQAREIAHFCSKKTGIPLKTNCCKRIRNTTKQTGLHAAQRKQNLKHSFAITNKLTVNSIAIVDDVMTTGATLSEISNTFLRAGVKNIHLWCIARTPLK